MRTGFMFTYSNIIQVTGLSYDLNFSYDGIRLLNIKFKLIAKDQVRSGLLRLLGSTAFNWKDWFIY